MVFSSLPFLLLFLPITVILYHYLLRNEYGKYAIPFVLLASLFFYAYWKPIYIFIILFSILVNFYLGKVISRKTPWQKPLFLLGISINILLLVYYKYTGFLLDTFSSITHINLIIPDIILPIGISFYTFQQIAYLSDIYTEKHVGSSDDFIQYATFVCFFPQLIAGPIVHHAEMMPQFADKKNHVFDWKNIYTGLCFLSIGLAKKILVADNVAPIVNYSFDTASSLTFFEAIYGCFGYIIQIYFDFSGYADMAIGCALFFNIRLPINFNSPYKAASIQEFWQRWHITLSRWIRDYIYFPLGGGKKGTLRAMLNMCITFIIGGLWHGAGWSYVLWGVLHGLALVVHRIWSRILGLTMPRYIAWPMTFLFVAFAAIAIRCVSFSRLSLFIDGLFGYNGFAIRGKFAEVVSEIWERTLGIDAGWVEFSFIMIGLLGITFTLKNSQQLIKAYIDSKVFHFFIMALLLISISSLILAGYSPEFIYFNF